MSVESKPTVEAGDRYEQSAFEPTMQIDREAGIMHGVHIMGRHSKHGYEYGLASQRGSVNRWEGMTVGIDHDYQGGPILMEQAWGEVLGPVTVNDDGTWGDIRYLKSHPLTEQILEAAEKKMKVGLSAVTRIRREQNKVVEDFLPIRLDVVVGPATVPTFFEQSALDDTAADMALEDQVLAILRTEGLSAADLKANIGTAIDAHYKINAAAESVEAAVAAVEVAVAEAQVDAAQAAVAEVRPEQAPTVANDARYEQMCAEIDALKKQVARQDEITKRFEQSVAAKTSLEETIKQATEKFDMNRFWHE